MRALWIGSQPAPPIRGGRGGSPPAGGVEVVRASELRSGLAQLADGGIDVVLLDLARDIEAFEALSELHSRAPDVPVVVVTSPGQEAAGVDAVQRGAQDWLARTQAEGSQLTRALRYAVERHRLQRTLRELSLTDELTGLYNRRGFLTLCDHHLKLARRTRGLLLARADIAGLKRINEQFGYEEGDRALQGAADVLRGTFRLSDVIARLSGDEFVILVLDAGDETAGLILPRLRERLTAHNATPTSRYALNVRMGVTRCAKGEAPSIEELLARSAIALADAKR
jgi:two-component system cell cycle response regulator